MEKDERIVELIERQTKDLFIGGELRKRQVAYTPESIGLMEKMLKFEDMQVENRDVMIAIMNDVGREEVLEIFENKELMSTTYKIDYDYQKRIAKEILGYEITVEEYLEKIMG